MPQPIEIPCALCVLRSWQKRDIDALVKQANNREVSRTLRDRFPFPYTVEAGRAWLSASVDEDPATSLAIEVDGELAGGIGVEPGRDIHRHTGEIGYWLGESYWGRGIATAAVTGFVPWAARSHALVRLWAAVFETNPSSMRVLEKNGFSREGVMRQQVLKDGRYIDQVIFGLVLPTH